MALGKVKEAPICMPQYQSFATPFKDHNTLMIIYYPSYISWGAFVYMVVAIKISNHLHQKFFHCDVDMSVVSFDFAPKRDYCLKVGELVVDVGCDVSLLESFSYRYVLLSWEFEEW